MRRRRFGRSFRRGFRSRRGRFSVRRRRRRIGLVRRIGTRM